jgi:histone-lysine N-methyltransferase SUV39H
MLLADDFQIGSMLLQHWNKFKTHTYRYLLDPQVIALAMIPKPFRMSKLEQQIFQTYFQDCAPLFDPLVGYEPKEHLVSILALLFGQDPSVLHNQFVDSGIILRRAIAPLDLNHDPLESLLDPDDSQDTERIAKELEQAIAREESELERLKEKLQLEYKNLALQQPWEQNDEKLHDLENEEYTSRIWEQRNKQYAEVRKMITKFMNEVDTEEGDESLSLIEVEDDNANVVEEYFFKIDDITQGRGEVAIPAINMADHNAFPDLTYIESFQKVPYGENAECIKNLILCTGCECRSSCDSGKCSCCGLQAQSHSFYAKDGRLKEPLQLGTIIFECNALCACADFKSKCVNRVVQNGSQLPLQVFKTKQKGWGVRTLVDIKAKQFVDEYLGEIISETEAETRGEMYDKRGCSYLFDLGSVDENNFTIDADKFANVTRFFNHSCDPNMGSARVCIDVQDINTARIAFFALRDVPAGEELTFDYKYQIQKRIRCYCGASNCKKWVQ